MTENTIHKIKIANTEYDLQDKLATEAIVDIYEELAQKSQVQLVTAESSNVLETLKIHNLSQEEYNQKIENGTIDEDALYLTPYEEIDLSGYATIEQLDTKADIEHTHVISDINNLQIVLDEILDESKEYTDNVVSNKANAVHTHNDIYYTETEIDEKLSNKADATHNHNDIYYTEDEIDSKLSNKADAIHTHDDVYDAKGSANEALSSAKLYADTVSTEVKNELLNGAGAAYDTLKELGDLIDENTNALEALETIASNKADSSHNHDNAYAAKSHDHNDIYYTESEVDGLIENHTHDSLYDSIGSASVALEASKAYTDNAVAQKSQVQIIRWEADD